LVISLGASPDKICYDNVAKKKQDILAAHELGLERYVVDSEAEIANQNTG
jgi:diaminopimelate decarboxylase